MKTILRKLYAEIEESYQTVFEKTNFRKLILGEMGKILTKKKPPHLQRFQHIYEGLDNYIPEI